MKNEMGVQIEPQNKLTNDFVREKMPPCNCFGIDGGS